MEATRLDMCEWRLHDYVGTSRDSGDCIRGSRDTCDCVGCSNGGDCVGSSRDVGDNVGSCSEGRDCT